MVRSAAYSAATLGRFEEALPLARQAIDLDPLNADSWEFLGETEFFVGQLNKAAADGKKALELSPDAWHGPILISQIYVMQGRAQDALSEIELVRYGLERTSLHAIACYALGRKKEADATLSELIAKSMQTVRTRSPRFMLSGTSLTKRSSGWTELMSNATTI